MYLITYMNISYTHTSRIIDYNMLYFILCYMNIDYIQTSRIIHYNMLYFITSHMNISYIRTSRINDYNMLYFITYYTKIDYIHTSRITNYNMLYLITCHMNISYIHISRRRTRPRPQKLHSEILKNTTNTTAVSCPIFIKSEYSILEIIRSNIYIDYIHASRMSPRKRPSVCIYKMCDFIIINM